MLGTALSGVLIATAWLLWGQRLSVAVDWCLETIGWYQLTGQLRLLLLLATIVVTVGLVTVTWPRLREPRKLFIQRISEAEFEEQKRRYTRKCLEDLRSGPDFAKHQRAVAAQRIVSSFEDASDYSSFEG